MDAQQIRDRVDAYVKQIQATLRDQIHADSRLAGMGTTWTSAHLMSDRALVVHIGDSRAYVLQQGELHQVTHDETVAQALIDSGAEPQSVSRFRHMLINSFGGETDDVKAQIYQLQIDAGDQILLCTDGLTDMLSDEGIASILQTSTSPQSACDRLIGAALENGGHDNVTVVLAAAM
jgi:serine/threonine protein phosphatase PrpC